MELLNDGKNLAARLKANQGRGFMAQARWLKEQGTGNSTQSKFKSFADRLQPEVQTKDCNKDTVEPNPDLYGDYWETDVFHPVTMFQTNTMFCFVSQTTQAEIRKRSTARTDRYDLAHPDIVAQPYVKPNGQPLDYYIANNTEWDDVMPVDVYFEVQNIKLQVEEQRLKVLVNNSIYIRKRIAHHMLYDTPVVIFNLTQEIADNEAYFGVLAQEISWNQAISGPKLFNIHSFLHFSKYYGFSEQYVLSLIEFDTSTSYMTFNTMTQAIFTSARQLGWSTLAKVMTQRMLGLPTSILSSIPIDNIKNFRESLRSAIKDRDKKAIIYRRTVMKPEYMLFEQIYEEEWFDIFKVIQESLKHMISTEETHKRVEVKWWIMRYGLDFRKSDRRFQWVNPHPYATAHLFE